MGEIEHEELERAYLRLYVDATGSVSQKVITVYGIDDEQWQEASITYDNAPRPGEYITTFSVNNESDIWYLINITDYVNDNLHKDVLSFRLYNVSGASSQNWINFVSRNSSLAMKPELRFY